MSYQARRYHPTLDQDREDWDRYLDPRWRRKGLHIVEGRHAHGSRHEGQAVPEAAPPRRGSLRLAGIPGGERIRSAIRSAARHWGSGRNGQIFHLLGKARGELVLEYPWLDPDYLYYKFIRRT